MSIYFSSFLWPLYKKTLQSEAKETDCGSTPGPLDGARVGFLSALHSRCWVHWRHHWRRAATEAFSQLLWHTLLLEGAGTLKRDKELRAMLRKRKHCPLVKGKWQGKKKLKKENMSKAQGRMEAPLLGPCETHLITGNHKCRAKCCTGPGLATMG